MNETAGTGQEANSVDAFVFRGEKAAESENWVEAKAFFEKARELDPAGWKPLQCLGVANFWLGRREEAWSQLVEALRRAPQEPDNETNLVDVARSIGREREAQDLLDSLKGTGRKFEGSPAESKCVEGEGMLAAELWNESVHPFLEAIDLDPERSRAWSGLGISCFRKGLKSAGSVFFEMAMRLDPDDEDAVLNWTESCGKTREEIRGALESAGVAPALVAKALEEMA